MKDSLNTIKWAGLLPSLNIFSGELLGDRISLISKGEYYELRINRAGMIHSDKVEKAYLSIQEKKEIIKNEFSRHT